jgi:hypothetical protein
MEYTAPAHRTEQDARSARVQIGGLGLHSRQKIAYIFDFGDEWRVRLSLREMRPGGETGILDRKGEAPPQYSVYEDEE